MTLVEIVIDAYLFQHIQPLLRANIHSSVLLNSLLSDLLTSLSAFANGFHLELHLFLISFSEPECKRGVNEPLSARTA